MHPAIPIVNRRRQRGASIIEVLGVLAIAAAMLGALVTQVGSSLEDAHGSQAAVYQAQIAGAAGQFIRNNYGALTAPGNLGVTLRYTLADLQAAGVLPPGTAGTNVYGQTPCVLLRPRLSGTPAAPVVDALIVTEGTAAQRIPDRQLAYVAAQSGPGGGYIAASDPGTARSSAGAWSLGPGTSPSLAQFSAARCSANAAGAGSLVSAVFAGQQSNDYLYRQPVPGMAQLNQMNTPLGMAGGAVVSAGAACGGGAAIAVDSGRNLMSCGSGGTWVAAGGGGSWKPSVANYAALPAGDSPGDVRLTRDTSRAYAYDGSQWRALAVDQNGDLAVPRDLRVTRDVNVGNNVNASTGTITGAQILGLDWVAGGTLQAWETARLGDPCNIPLMVNGAPAYDGNNQPIYINRVGTILVESRTPWPGRTPTALICSGTGPGNAFLVHLDG